MIEFDTTVRIGRTPGPGVLRPADFETYLALWAKEQLPQPGRTATATAAATT
jgi:hypothetical protein